MAYAAGCGHVEVVEWLLAHGGHVEDTEMREVVARGNEDVARLLIARGARVAGKDSLRASAEVGPDLLQAAVYAGQVRLVPVLARQRHDMQIVNDQRESLLDIATMYDVSPHPEPVKALIEAGVHVNPLSANEEPPLYWAARSNQLGVVAQLLAAGANVDVPVAQHPCGAHPCQRRVRQRSRRLRRIVDSILPIRC